MEKSKEEESPWEKKTGAKNKEKVPLCQVKNKIPLWKRLVLTELHAGVQTSNDEVAVQPKFAKQIRNNGERKRAGKFRYLKYLSRSVRLRITSPIFLATPTLDADIYTTNPNIEKAR